VGTRFGRQLTFIYACLGHHTGAFLRDPPTEVMCAPVWYFPVFWWCQYEQDHDVQAALRKHWAFVFNQTEIFKLELGIAPLGAKENQWLQDRLWNHATRPPQGELFPTFRPTGWPLHRSTPTLGTLDIVETAAAIQGLRMEAEATSSSCPMWFDLPQEQRSVLSRLDYRYWAGLRYVEERTRISHELAPAVVVLAADIALDSGVEDLLASPHEVPWEDWHPAWRFVKAVSAIEALIMADEWPATESELGEYIGKVYDRCSWRRVDAVPDYALFNVFQDKPSPADRIRAQLFAEADRHRISCPSLWSIGSREQLLDASIGLFRPPLVLRYGSDAVEAWRGDLGEEDVSGLWGDIQLNHVALQLLSEIGGAVVMGKPHIECFYSSKDGRVDACPDGNEQCGRWTSVAKVPSCGLRGALQGLAGQYWKRLTPIDLASLPGQPS